jgi:hypothetical protein
MIFVGYSESSPEEVKKMTQARPILFILAACLVMAGVSTDFAGSLSLEDILIDSKEVSPVCETIEGEHAVSIQARTLFKMVGEGAAGAITYGNPKNRQFQSFSCDGTKATVYYYEYGSATEVERRLGSIKMLLWGEKEPSELHPELVLGLDNIVAVVSSSKPDFLATVLSHRKTFPDLSDGDVDEYMRGLRCSSGKRPAEELCSALRDFKSGQAPKDLEERETLLFGRSWDVSKDGHAGEAMFEILYVGQIPGKGTVASLATIELENDDERNQMQLQLKAQAEGGNADAARRLLADARDALGTTKAPVRKVGNRSLAFLAYGERMYVRRVGARLILTTDLMYEGKERPFVVAVFPAKPSSP